MIRMMGLTGIALFFAGTHHARADLVITTDPTTFVSNDSAPWVRSFGGGTSSSTASGLGTFSFSFDTFSVPVTNSLVATSAGALFVGVSSTGTGFTASYVVTAQFDYRGSPVYGFGFRMLQVSPATDLTVFDVAGGSRSFRLDTSPGGYLTTTRYNTSNFIGITSDVPISRFQFEETVTDSTAILHVDAVSINVAVPTPSALLIALIGVAVSGVRLRRRAARH